MARNDLDESIWRDLWLHVSNLEGDSGGVKVVGKIQTWTTAHLTRNKRKPRHGEIRMKTEDGPGFNDLISMQ